MKWIVNWSYIYIYIKGKDINISDYPTLENYLFGGVSLTKNADIDKYKYSGYGIGFDRGIFHFQVVDVVAM